MDMFAHFDSTFGDGHYGMPDGLGGTNVWNHGGHLEGNIHADGTGGIQIADGHTGNLQAMIHSDGAHGATIHDAHETLHGTMHSNGAGGVHINDGHGILKASIHPNGAHGANVFDADGHLGAAMHTSGFGGVHLPDIAMPAAVGDESYFSAHGNTDAILGYQDPLAHSAEYHMNPFHMTGNSL